MKKRFVNIHEAKTHFSSILKLVKQGETITIMHAGEPVALLSPLVHERKAGEFEGKIIIEDDFDDPLDPLTFKPQKSKNKTQKAS